MSGVTTITHARPGAVVLNEISNPSDKTALTMVGGERNSNEGERGTPTRSLVSKGNSEPLILVEFIDRSAQI